jgi:hypothetical protein
VDGRVKPGHDERETHFQAVGKSLKMKDEATEQENAPALEKFWIARIWAIAPNCFKYKMFGNRCRGRLGYWL